MAALEEMNIMDILKLLGAIRSVPPPPRGWLHAARSALRTTGTEAARRIGSSRQLPLQLEKSEVQGSISLKRLRSVANALGFELVYALVPMEHKARQMRLEALRPGPEIGNVSFGLKKRRPEAK
jgi:transcriptional regulator with XRE-family HTH domain